MTEYKRTEGSGLYDIHNREVCKDDILELEDGSYIICCKDQDGKWIFVSTNNVQDMIHCSPVYNELPTSAKIIIFACEEE